jgi:hypothetical protein
MDLEALPSDDEGSDGECGSDGEGSDGEGSDGEGSDAPTPPQAPPARTRNGRRQQQQRQQRPQQQRQPVEVEMPLEAPAPPLGWRRRAAATTGLAATLQAVRDGGVSLQHRNTPRRAAAAGVLQAAAAAAASSSDSEAAGPTLEDLAAAAAVAAAVDSPAPARPKRTALAAVREHVAAAQERNCERIEGQRRQRGKPKDFQVGDLVFLKLPLAVRGPLDQPNLLCRVLDVDNRSLFKLRCNSGILNDRYHAEELSRAPAAAAAGLTFEGLGRRGVPKVAIAAAAATQHVGAAAVRCACRKGCTSRCACKKAGVLCSRECKCPTGCGHSCENY